MRKSIFILSLLTLALAGARGAAADPAADKLFAEAKAEREEARKLREAAWKLAEQAGDDELKANHIAFKAHLKELKALSILKADATKLKAWRLRHEARVFWRAAWRQRVAARNARARAAHQKHEAAELTKAADLVKDQKAVHDALLADAKGHLAMAARYENTAKGHEAAAKRDADKAHQLWDEAGKLDPQHKTPPPSANKAPSAPPPAPAP